jgi:drug/metabolite transporter (DMT)-like permease
LINQTQPLFAGLAGYIVLSSMPSLVEWIGGGLILLGAVIIRGAKKE